MPGIYVVSVLLVACATGSSVVDPPASGVDWLPQVDGKSFEEMFPAPVEQLDVLLVLDSNDSLGEEWDGVWTELVAVLDALMPSEIDFHLGVVTMDMEDPAKSGKLRQAGGGRWVERDMADPYAVFAQMAELVGTSVADRRGADAVFAALETQALSYNDGFHRDRAPLRVVMVSDGDDVSQDLSATELIAFLDGLGPDVSLSAIVGDACPDALAAGTAFGDAVMGGGLQAAVCDAGWGTAAIGPLDALARTTLHLSRLADPATIEVVWTDDGAAFHPVIAWHFDVPANAVVLDDPDEIPDTAEVSVRYSALNP